jgi:Domain of unknown function (DUF4135)
MPKVTGDTENTSMTLFLRAFSTLSGWRYPTHFDQYDEGLTDEANRIVEEQLGIKCKEIVRFGAPNFQAPFNYSSLLDAASAIISAVSSTKFQKGRDIPTAMVMVLSKAIARYSVTSIKLSFVVPISTLYRSVLNASRDILERHLGKIFQKIFATRVDGENAEKLLKDLWFFYPYSYYFLANLSIYFSDGNRRIAQEMPKYSSIFDTAGKLRISLLKSDFHPFSGPSYLISTTAENGIVLKPRSAAPLRMLYELYSKCLADAGMSCESKMLDSHVVKIESYATYSAFPEVSQKQNFSEIEIETYYKAAGILIACAYILDVTDLHYENIIASCIPMPIDVESIFYWKASAQTQEKRGGVLASGLLPFSVGRSKTVKFDLSGLGCIREHISPFFSRSRNNQSFGNLALISPTSNRVLRIDGSAASIKNHSFAVIDGFLSASSFFNQHSTELASWARTYLARGLSCRVYHEPTMVYDRLLWTLSEPELMSNSSTMCCAVDQLLARDGRVTQAATGEKEELLAFGIPRTMVDLVRMNDQVEDILKMVNVFEDTICELGNGKTVEHIRRIRKALDNALF